MARWINMSSVYILSFVRLLRSSVKYVDEDEKNLFIHSGNWNRVFCETGNS